MASVAIIDDWNLDRGESSGDMELNVVVMAAGKGTRMRSAHPKVLHRLAELSQRCGAPMVAVGDVLYHAAERRVLQDVLTAIREKTTVQAAAGPARLGVART